MKVDPGANPSLPATTPVDAEKVRPGGSASGPVRDRVRLSADLRLVNAAVSQAMPSDPDVRPEAVARGQTLIASGELGADLDALADRIMDTLVYSHENDHS